MTIEEKILEGFKNLIKKTMALQDIKIVKVKSIDKEKNIIVATTDEGVDMDGIRIGVVENNEVAVKVYPTTGSLIAIGSIDNSDADYIMLVADEIESAEIKIKDNIFKIDLSGIKIEFKNSTISIQDQLISFNGGDNGSFIIIQKLVEKLNKVEQQCNILLQKLQGVSVALAPTGSYPFLPIFSSVQPLQTTQVSDIENNKIKH